MSIAEIVKDFSAKRKAFLRAHAKDYQSAETSSAYCAQEDAWERLEDRMRTVAMDDPDGPLIRALETVS